MCVLAAFALDIGLPSRAAAQTTALFIDSEPGDPLGGGQRLTYSPPDAIVTVSAWSPGSLSVTVRNASYSYYWNVEFKTQGQPFQAGTYENAYSDYDAPFNSMRPYRSGATCPDGTGRFLIREIERDTSSQIQRLAIDFEYHCGGATPALFGAFRYNSTVSTLAPFDDAYPDYRLTVSPPAHGNISGPGIDCGLSGATCVATFGTSTLVALSATPEDGYEFLGWSGACFGSGPAQLTIHGPRTCGAVFAPLTPTPPRTVLVLDGQPGSIGGGIRDRVAGEASRWRVPQWTYGVSFEVIRADGIVYVVNLAGPDWTIPVAGTYESAVDERWPRRPYLDVTVGTEYLPVNGTLRRPRVRDLRGNGHPVLRRLRAPLWCARSCAVRIHPLQRDDGQHASVRR